MGITQLLGVSVILLVVIPSSLSGQEAQPLSLTVTISEMEVVSDPLRVRVRVTNSSSSDVTVLKTELELPYQFVAGPRKTTVEFVDGVFDLDNGESREIEVRIPALSWRNALILFLFRNKPYTALIRMQYQILPSRDIHSGSPTEFTLSPQGPGSGVVIGGAIGVLALVVFRWLYGKWRPSKVRERKPKTWVTIALGCVVVAMATVIFRFTAMDIPQSPLAIHVKDFYGGFLLGLAFEPMAQWLASILGATETRTS